MDKLFTLPIHGVACLPFYQNFQQDSKRNKPSETLYKIHLSFSTVTFDNTLDRIWVLEDRGERYASTVQLFANKQINETEYFLKIDCQGHGLVKIAGHHLTVDWRKNGTGFSHYFQTLVAALWLELQSVLCIHANALSKGADAIALIAPSRTGKTTLTTALTKQGMHAMTDDMLALHKNGDDFDVYPSWPVARMWPDALEYFEQEAVLNPAQVLSKVHEKFDKKTVALNAATTANDQFANAPKKLRTIYFLNRVEGLAAEIEIIDVPKSKALIYLLQNSILGDAYSALNIEHDRLQTLSHLLKFIECKQINYRSGLSYIDKVAEKIVMQL